MRSDVAQSGASLKFLVARARNLADCFARDTADELVVFEHSVFRDNGASCDEATVSQYHAVVEH